MKTPWARAQEQKYQTQEKRTGKKPGARQQINSGRTWFALRDVKQQSPVAFVLIDNKTTGAASYKVTLDDFKKLKSDANRTPPGCLPALQIDLCKGLEMCSLMVIEDAHWDSINDYITFLESRISDLEKQSANRNSEKT